MKDRPKHRKCIGDNRGFTLAELLITVGIVVILCTLGTIAIFRIQKNLRQKELDSKAEIICEAAQNQITKLKTAGDLTARSTNAHVRAGSDTQITNSLFGYDVNGSISEKGVAYIDCGRHLQNLHNTSGVAASVTTAVQSSNLYFSEQGAPESAEETWYEVYADRPFTPIVNENLVSYDGSCEKDSDDGDSAFLRFSDEQKGFDSIYDYEGKTWVDEPHGVHIEGYEESQKNLGKVIHVICDEYGSITMEWVDPLRYRATE